MINVLDEIVGHRGKPERIQVDNASNFTFRSTDLWTYLNKVKPNFSRPGKPTVKAFIASLNGIIQAKCFNEK